MPSARARTVRVKSSRERVAAIFVRIQGTTRLAGDEDEGRQHGDLDHGERQRHRQARALRTAREDRRHHHEHQHGQQVLDHQPPDGDVARRRVEVAIVRQDPDEHDRARDRQPDAKHEAGSASPAKGMGDQQAQARGDRALRDGAGDRHAPDRDQLFDVELHADAEHQQDDADLGQLLRHVAVGHEAWSVGADEEPGDEIADDRGEADAMGGEAEDQRRAEAAGQRQDEIDRVHPSIICSEGSGFRVQGSRFSVKKAEL